MKRRRLRLELSEHQHLLIAVVLVILLAASLLYCVGFASLAVGRVWENMATPTANPEAVEEGIDLSPVLTTTLAPIPTGP